MTDSDGTLTNVELLWGTTSGALGTTINMTIGAGDTYSTVSNILHRQTEQLFFMKIKAVDNESGETTTAEQSYTVSNPATATLPYSQDFATGFGDTYSFSVLGATKQWTYSSSEYVFMNGYNSGKLKRIGLFYQD